MCRPSRAKARSSRRAPPLTKILRKSWARKQNTLPPSHPFKAGDFAGSCDEGFSCAYTNSISWLNATTPLPMENDPRVLFERLFGDDGTTDPVVRRAHREEGRSVLDAVTEQIGRLQRGLGSIDQAKMGQYLEAIRDIERRIDIAEKQSSQEL